MKEDDRLMAVIFFMLKEMAPINSNYCEEK